MSKNDWLYTTPHMHRHIEIVALKKGSFTAFINSERHEVKEGEAFIAFPNQIHSYEHNNEIESELIIFSPDFCREFSRELTASVPSNPVFKMSDFLKETISRIIEINTTDDKYKDIILKGCMLVVLSEIFKKAELIPLSNRHDSVMLDLLNYCSQNFREDISLSVVSKKLNISKFYISHIFPQKTGVSFFDYITTLRLQDACYNLVYTDMSVTEAALTSGFASIRSFNRVFRAKTGLTPTQYRNENR